MLLLVTTKCKVYTLHKIIVNINSYHENGMQLLLAKDGKKCTARTEVYECKHLRQLSMYMALRSKTFTQQDINKSRRFVSIVMDNDTSH